MQGQIVGKLSIDKDENYHFEYDESWIEKGFAISPHLEFDSPHTSSTIKRFLENLIPEGEGLEDIDVVTIFHTPSIKNLSTHFIS